MAIDLNATQFLMAARKQGVAFGKVLMFGRQNLDVFPGRLKSLFEGQGLPGAALLATLEKAPTPLYAEPLFQALGATEVCSLDASDYQSATFVHDMNLPVPDSLKNRFDLVYDGGSLEHVFHAPMAIKNCMEMLRPGGRFFLNVPANNWFGHGFYQFSPEFFYRALSAENGFEMERMIAYRPGPLGRWYQVQDPKKVGARAELISLAPIMFLIQARKIRDTEVFARSPQQSDYVATWDENDSAAAAGEKNAPAAAGWFSRTLPGPAHFFRALGTAFKFFRTHSFANRKFFVPVDRNR